MTLSCGMGMPPRCVGVNPVRVHRTPSRPLMSLHHPPRRADQLRVQLDQLRTEAEIARSKANSARVRLMRLTEAAENLQRRAARSIQVGKETEARELLIQKKKLTQALEKSKSRIEVLDKLSAKITEAISLKETQLIGQVTIQPEDDRSDSCQQVHFISPKDDDTGEILNSNNAEGPLDHILEHIDGKLSLVEIDIEDFLKSQTLVEESNQKQVNEKLQKISEILKDVLSIREKIASMMEMKQPISEISTAER